MRILFLINEYSLHNHILSSYIRARPQDELAIMKVPLVLKGKSRTETGAKILPQLSPRFVVEKFYEFLLLGAITWTPKILRRGEVFHRLRRIAGRHGLPFLKCDSISSPEALAFIRSHSPDLIITLMHQIVKGELLTIAPIINIHPGLLPEFRGIQPYFWALSEGHGSTGASLHRIEDEGIDTGGLLAKVSFPVPASCSVCLAYYMTARAVATILPETVERLSRGDLQTQAQSPDEGAYHRWPDRAAFQRLWARGYALVRTRDILKIICGDYDSFQPTDVKFY